MDPFAAESLFLGTSPRGHQDVQSKEVFATR